MDKKQTPYFITLEGIEGAGKSTALHHIRQYLEKENIPHIVTREPGGTLIAEAIRQVLLTPHKEIMEVDTELLLMFASRAQHMARVILPALSEGKWVVCDRFTDATYAYQGGGRCVPRERIATLETWVQKGLQPQLTLLLDLPVSVGLSRIGQRKISDRFEQEKAPFFERIREVYLQRAKEYPERYRIIDAACDLKEVQAQIDQVMNYLLGKH